MGCIGKILIVDDDPKNVKLIAARLPSNSFQKRMAYNGREALESAADFCPDIILLDIMMPDMDGYQVAETLRRNPETREICIIMITALDGSGNKARALRAGADDFLSKPVHPAELLARIRNLLNLKKLKTQLRRGNKPAAAKPQPTATKPQPTATPTAVKTNEKSRLLYVGNNGSHSESVKQWLVSEQFSFEAVQSEEDALKHLQQQQVDLIVLDVTQPRSQASQFARQIKQQEATQDIQILLLWPAQNNSQTPKPDKWATDDFLPQPIAQEPLQEKLEALVNKKASLDRLRCTMKNSVQSVQTGSMDFYFFYKVLKNEISRARRYNLPFSLLWLKIDEIPEQEGNSVDDNAMKLLKELHQFVADHTRDVDVATPIGDGEILLLLPHTPTQGAAHVAVRLKHQIAVHTFESRRHRSDGALPLRIGVAPGRIKDEEIMSLIQRASRALYQAKLNGKNQISVVVDCPVTGAAN